MTNINGDYWRIGKSAKSIFFLSFDGKWAPMIIIEGEWVATSQKPKTLMIVAKF